MGINDNIVDCGSTKSEHDQAVKDNLFSYKIPEVLRQMIDVLVVIKIPEKEKELTPQKRKKLLWFIRLGKIMEILELFGT